MMYHVYFVLTTTTVYCLVVNLPLPRRLQLNKDVCYKSTLVLTFLISQCAIDIQFCKILICYALYFIYFLQLLQCHMYMYVIFIIIIYKCTFCLVK